MYHHVENIYTRSCVHTLWCRSIHEYSELHNVLTWLGVLNWRPSYFNRTIEIY